MAFPDGRNKNVEPRAFVVVQAAEDELLRLYFTHPTKMDGAGKLKQHDNVHKQITAFEKLLQHAMSRFSREKLFQMLRILQRGNVTPRSSRIPDGTENGDYDYNESINSIEQLRNIVSTIKSERRPGMHKEEETHLINYFEAFFEDVRYLNDLKEHFDEKIYCCLYDYFYDPLDDVNGAFDIDIHGDKALIILEEEKDSGNSSMPGSDEEHRTPRTRRVTFYPSGEVEEKPGVKLDHMNDREKLSYAVRELFHVNQNWDKIIAEEELDTEWFEVDSHYELLEYSGYGQFELLFRLVPDIFVKAFKSVELAKLWWTQANKVYPRAPKNRNFDQDFTVKVQTLERNVKDLVIDIAEEEQLHKNAQTDLEHLKLRENRYNILSSSCEQVEEMLNETNQTYNSLYKKRDDIKYELDNLLPGSGKHKAMEDKLFGYDKKLIETNGKLKLIKYHFDILQDDFNLELEVRPTIIRFVADVQVRVRDLEDSLIIRHQIKRQTEKQLVLLKTNCDRMRKIMRKQLGTTTDNENQGQKPKVDKKRTRRRPSSNERKAAKERFQKEKKMVKNKPLPDELKPRRDATFVTIVASDQDSLDERDTKLYDSLESDKAKIHTTAQNHAKARERSRDKREAGPRRSQRRSQSRGRGSETESGKSQRGGQSEYDSERFGSKNKLDDSWIKPTPRRVSRRDRDKRRRSPAARSSPPRTYRAQSPSADKSRETRNNQERGRERDKHDR